MIRATRKVLLRKKLKRIILNICFILIITFVITDINCLLLDYLENYTVESFPSYRVNELLVTNYLIVKYGR